MPVDVRNTEWRAELPVLTGRTLTLREPQPMDADMLAVLLAAPHAPRFGLDEPLSEIGIHDLLDRIPQDRAAGLAFCYAITMTATQALVGFVRVRRLDLSFDSAEWEGILTASARGTGAFLEAARLVGSFAFGVVGTFRIEARIALENGRGNGAMRKLGAVQEGILRRSGRRGADFVDQVLWSLMRDDWGDHWVATTPRVH